MRCQKKYDADSFDYALAMGEINMKIIIEMSKEEYLENKRIAQSCGWGDEIDMLVKENIMDNSDMIYDAEIRVLSSMETVVNEILRDI